MSAENSGSLAEWFARNPQARAIYRQQNPSSATINNYVFNCELIKDNLRCNAGNDCQWFTVSAEERKSPNLRRMVLCITCDNLYHLQCAGTDFSRISENQLPWLCSHCSVNAMNPAAQQLVISGRHKLSFDDRVKCFIKSSPSDTDSEELDDNENETLHLDRKCNRFPKEALLEIMKLREENKNLQQQLAENSKLMTDILKNQPSTSGITSQERHQESRVNAHLSSGLQGTSYSDAILSTHRVSTRINEELQRSQSAMNLLNSKERNAEATSTSNVENQVESTMVNNTLRHLSKLTISELRRNLPKIDKFDGSPDKWLTFQQAVNRNWKEGEYNSDEMRNQIRNALTGLALERVNALLPLMSAEQIMSVLKDCFGNSYMVVESAKYKLMNTKLSKPLTHASCVEVTTYIASYMAACSYAGILITDSSVSSRIHDQLEPYHQQMYYDFYFRKLPNAATRMERLDIQFEFLNSLSRTLPLGSFNKCEDKGKNKGDSFQVMAASTKDDNSSHESTEINERYKYEIKDKQSAVYIGYDLEKVKQLPQHCEICSSTNHYSVECKAYRGMETDMKYQTAKSKNLCMNCMLTTNHKAKDCDVKIGCGYKIKRNVRCTAKHHISLHPPRNEESNRKGFDRQTEDNESNNDDKSTISEDGKEIESLDEEEEESNEVLEDQQR